MRDNGSHDLSFDGRFAMPRALVRKNQPNIHIHEIQSLDRRRCRNFESKAFEIAVMKFYR